MPNTKKLTRGRVSKIKFGDLFSLVHILYLSVAASILQRTTSIPKLIRFFDTDTPPPTKNIEKMERIVWLTDGVLWFLFDEAFCVKKSLILYHYGRRNGLPIRINFGVQKAGDDLKGHAWVEVDGTPFGEKAESSAPYKVIYSEPLID